MTKNQEISRRIIEKATAIASRDGITTYDATKEAIDHVIGEGTYDRLVSDLYDGLRAKAA